MNLLGPLNVPPFDKQIYIQSKANLALLYSEMKWNESGFRPPLCTYRLNWARRTSWGWWDDWDDTVLQTQDSKFEPWRSEAEHATSRSRRLPTILTFTRGWGRNNIVSFKPPRPGTESRTLAWKAAVLTTTIGPPPFILWSSCSKVQCLMFKVQNLKSNIGNLIVQSLKTRNPEVWGLKVCCPESAVPSLLSQVCCPKSAVPSLLSEVCCPSLLSQACCPESAVPSLMYQLWCLKSDVWSLMPEVWCPKSDIQSLISKVWYPKSDI